MLQQVADEIGKVRRAAVIYRAGSVPGYQAGACAAP